MASYISKDIKHSTSVEQRYSGLGQTKNKRLLFAAFTIRNEEIRIISVRDMKRIERKGYEEAQSNT
ncbi:MAG TPA: BrnT family toxin [Candidatus Dormibacteraeota bacterium]|nr:BrnT family toxin [Candidatus Dormibacteraeota bacterium]